MPLTLIAIALAPVIFLLSFIYLKDVYNKEPLKHLVTSFVLGIFSTIPAIIIEFFWSIGLTQNNMNIPLTLVWAFIVIALTEEFVKWVILNFYAYRLKEFDEPFDGIIYGMVISLGFAALENVMYVIDLGFEVGILRMFTAVPAHASFGIIMGYYFGLAWRHKKSAWRYKLRALIVAVIMHGLYDYFLIQENYPAFSVFSFIGLAISLRIAFKAIKSHQEASPFHPERLNE